MFRHLDNFLKVIVILLPLTVLVAMFVTQKYADSLELTRDELRERAIGRNIELLENVAHSIQLQLDAGNDLFDYADAGQRERFESMLRIAQLSDFQYLYAVYKDNEGDFRFWLDSETDEASRSEFGQYFNPASDIWERVYRLKRVDRTAHEAFEGLWITVAVPIWHADEIIAIIGADISYKTEAGIAADLRSFYVLSSKITWLLSTLLLLIFVLVVFYGKRRSRSLKDPLTGAYNRAFFHEVISKRFEKGYYVLIIDIDHFKKINDTYGHDAGDRVLKQLSRRIRRYIRHDDYFVRFGGEEFLIFMYERRKDEALHFAHRLLELVSSTPFDTGTAGQTVTVSIGLDLSGKGERAVDDAIKAADEALYRAKTSGRNRVEITE